MSAETLPSRAWSCASLAVGAAAAVEVGKMPLKKFNKEEIQNRLKELGLGQQDQRDVTQRCIYIYVYITIYSSNIYS